MAKETMNLDPMKFKKIKDGDDKSKKKADSLDKVAYKKRLVASEQEKIGKAQIKNNQSSHGSDIPVGKERIDLANKLKKEAEMDEYKASILRKKN